MCDACPMPWMPELFSTPVVQRVLDKQRQERLVALPFFDGLLAGEPDALVGSFAGEPRLCDPVRGSRRRRAGVPRVLAARAAAWLPAAQRRGGGRRRTSSWTAPASRRWCCTSTVSAAALACQFAIVADRAPDRRIEELRVYYSGWALTGRHVIRPPVLQPGAEVSASDVVAEHQRALATRRVDAIVATFEPDGYAREPAGGGYVHAAGAALADAARLTRATVLRRLRGARPRRARRARSLRLRNEVD